MRLPAWVPILGLAAIVSCGFGAADPLPISNGSRSPFNALLHWRKGGRDWLVVADGKADELVVYDAADGRPLRRLHVSQGLQDVAPLMQRDGRLFVVGSDGVPGELSLPQLALATVDHH